MAKRNHPEQAIQRAVVQHLERRGASGLFWFAIPNGGWRSKTEAAILKGQGVRAGVPDLCLIHEGKPYFLELKAEGGKASIKQTLAALELESAGARVGMAVGLDNALAVLESWGLLRGRAA